MMSQRSRRALALWLSVVLMCLSFVASAHHVRHVDDGAKNHCTLCFHLHHYNKYLPQTTLNVLQVKQSYLLFDPPVIAYSRIHRCFFNSRGPPVTS
ncbi:ABC-type zinc uptake system zinc chaperone [Shewanella surugensis]|uniref:ABC-type zinc uptake system zinc chaperone n=1 Tax=Shewanella surugensis TaxID=212020 RepID=A0ABT0L5R8_9GAMM|nr:ABC-type zinc uptake system zinc chaperone [Shewanella surugensis]MCL1123032.1 ABC-type zinc uptake system zinc chaperone [Shewanella surugensis]